MNAMRQLALPFAEPSRFSPEDFCPAPSNAGARAWLAAPERWSNGRLIVHGEAGVGKTHLLHIWAGQVRAQLIEGAALRGLPQIAGPLAIDDADAVPDPTALLHLLNAACEFGFAVLLASRLAPHRMGYKLADLTSRLRASSEVEIRPPEDELLEMLLLRLAAERQLNLSIPVRNLLMLHLPRSGFYYREAIARLDRLALDRSARITRGLATDIVTEMLSET
jgi:chromosomal replication initiation ATPase DnaA